jgi:hypothetical protein
MPDKYVHAYIYAKWLFILLTRWEYPFFAAWDTAFHCIPLAVVDPAFAKSQLDLLTREWYMKPDGQIPAYEWNFSDVNPPVHAWYVRVHCSEQHSHVVIVGQLSEYSKSNASCTEERTYLSLNASSRSFCLISLGQHFLFFRLRCYYLIMYVGGSIGRIKAETMSLKADSSGWITSERSIGRSLYLLVGHCDRQMERPGWPSTA